MNLLFNIRVLAAFRHDEESQVYVGFCPSLQIYAQGNTNEEAERSLKSAITLFVRNCFKRNILEKFLKARGFNATGLAFNSTQEKMSEYIDIQEKRFELVKDIDVPINFLRSSDQECHPSVQLAH